MSNADRIRQMSDGELSRKLAQIQADACEELGIVIDMPFKYTAREILSAASEWLDWLKQEVKE